MKNIKEIRKIFNYHYGKNFIDSFSDKALIEEIENIKRKGQMYLDDLQLRLSAELNIFNE